MWLVYMKNDFPFKYEIRKILDFLTTEERIIASTVFNSDLFSIKKLHFG